MNLFSYDPAGKSRSQCLLGNLERSKVIRDSKLHGSQLRYGPWWTRQLQLSFSPPCSPVWQAIHVEIMRYWDNTYWDNERVIHVAVMIKPVLDESLTNGQRQGGWGNHPTWVFVVFFFGWLSVKMTQYLYFAGYIVIFGDMWNFTIHQ